uniref:Uncharacterized protein LOC111132197 n=1 Tax=Crassostrea virginica TaxID=6565 RepID=A0A8B8E890_CRAVI|nr:uncharacterized protein LOC111132197 [Crassostrea virginica]
MQSNTFLWIVALLFLIEIEAVRWSTRGNENCPRRNGTDPYYFGTTNLLCMLREKREAPRRAQWEITHRFLYYQGYYFDFLENSKVEIGRSRLDGHRCDGGLEASPAGYSNVSIECLKGCARNYRCHFGDHSLLFNNCHYFANRLSSVLCTSKEGLCPTWCLKSCDDATDYTTEGV